MSATTSVIVEYIWTSGQNTHHDIRSKCKTVVIPSNKSFTDLTPSDLPLWNFDGSSTAQAKGLDTEIVIKPVAVFPHPFIDDVPSLAVLCECYLPNGQPTADNTRVVAASVFEHKQAKGAEPWFGMEQEYVLMQRDRPYGWPADGNPPPQGPYYCSNGANVAFGRKYAMEHYRRCIKIGIKISGTNAEVMPGQWEYQVGPCRELEMGDHLIMSRWVYLRILEAADEPNLDINFDVKPEKGDWNGSGLHTNFSTTATRADGGMEAIKACLDRLKKTFATDIIFYSEDNNQRLTGIHETSSLAEFNYGVGTRGTSCRIPNEVSKNGKGYFEDRRPGADADPYLVSSRLFASACGVPAPALEALEERYIQPWMNENKIRNNVQQQ